MKGRLYLLLLLIACTNQKEEETVQPEMVQLKVLDYETLAPISGAAVELQECSRVDLVFGCLDHKTVRTLHTDQEGLVEFDRKIKRDNIVVRKANYLTDNGKYEDCRPAPPSVSPANTELLFLLPQTPVRFNIKGDAKNDSTEWVEVAAYYKGSNACEFSFLLGGNLSHWDTAQRIRVNRDTVLQRAGLANRTMYLKVRYLVSNASMPVVITHTRTLQEVFTPAGVTTEVEIEL